MYSDTATVAHGLEERGSSGLETAVTARRAVAVNAGYRRRAAPQTGILPIAMSTAPVSLLPDDEFNRQLAAHVHPPEWKNPTPDGRYNLVVIGAGTAGLVTAAVAAGIGAKVALIERHLMGGDCLNVGCVPSKGIIRAARVWASARHGAEFGLTFPGGVEHDFGTAMARMRRLRAAISHVDSAERFKGLGVDVFIGEGRFTGRDTVRVGEATLRFARAAVCTGARATALPIPGLAEAGFLTNETVFSLTALPRRLAVIGAGPIGCELAQAFARFGSEVTVFELTPHILPREDPDAAAMKGKRGRVLVEERYNWGLESRKLIAFYERIRKRRH